MKETLYRNNITVKKSNIQGYGVFAAQDIKAGEVIFISYGNSWFANKGISYRSNQKKPLGFKAILRSLPPQVHVLIAILIIALIFIISFRP